MGLPDNSVIGVCLWDYFTMKDDDDTPDPNEEEDDIFYCSLCDLEVLFSKTTFVMKV